MVCAPFPSSNGPLFADKRHGHPKRLAQVARVGNALARDIEGRAVIHGGSDDRQAEGYVHGAVEGDGLDRNVSLVVVHADDPVEVALPGPHEYGVRRQGTRDPPTPGTGFLTRFFDGGRDDADLLVPEESALARMGIQSAYGDPRRRHAHAGQRVADQVQGDAYFIFGQAVDGVSQGDVSRRVGDQDPVEGQREPESFRSRDFGQQFGMAGVGVSGQAHGRLVHRRGDQGGDVACHGHAGGPLHGFHGKATGFGLHTTRHQAIDCHFRFLRIHDINRAVTEQARIGMFDRMDVETWSGTTVALAFFVAGRVMPFVVAMAFVVIGGAGPDQRQDPADDFIMPDDQRPAQFVDPFL